MEPHPLPTAGTVIGLAADLAEVESYRRCHPALTRSLYLKELYVGGKYGATASGGSHAWPHRAGQQTPVQQDEWTTDENNTEAQVQPFNTTPGGRAIFPDP
jgi:hypothetical protein